LTEPGDPRPLPQPDELTQFYWDAAAASQFVLQRCTDCAKYQFPPDVVCIHCQSTELAPEAVSGQGILYSYTVVSRPFHQGFIEHLPYVVGLIELSEQAGLKVLTNVVDVDLDQLSVGMPVEVTFETRGDVRLPQFRPSRTHP
jgi:uncharacterized OB-fold protein